MDNTLGAGIETGQMAAERKPKHVEINQALNYLEHEVSNIRNFITKLSEGPTPPGDENAKQPEPTFLDVYNNLSDRLQKNTKHIAESIQILREMLL